MTDRADRLARDLAASTARGNRVLGAATVAVYVVLFAVALSVLSGCARTRTVTRTEAVEVRVPVAAECPAPPPAVRPDLPIARVDSTSADGEVAQMYLATVLVLQGYAAELERLLDAYRPRSDSTSGIDVPPDSSRPGRH